MTTVAFVCVQNAGRSQMAAAFAEKEQKRRTLEGQVDVLTGGTQPAEAVHDTVVEVMEEIGIDLRNRTPRTITSDELEDCDYVVTMGCSAEGICPATWTGESRDWNLDDPHGKDLDTVRDIRDEIDRRVRELLDELMDAG
ncbi:MAG: low molecular weight phosphatase family protein [Natronomonas sp.]